MHELFCLLLSNYVQCAACSKSWYIKTRRTGKVTECCITQLIPLGEKEIDSNIYIINRKRLWRISLAKMKITMWPQNGHFEYDLPCLSPVSMLILQLSIMVCNIPVLVVILSKYAYRNSALFLQWPVSIFSRFEPREMMVSMSKLALGMGSVAFLDKLDAHLLFWDNCSHSLNHRITWSPCLLALTMFGRRRHSIIWWEPR